MNDPQCLMFTSLTCYIFIIGEQISNILPDSNKKCLSSQRTTASPQNTGYRRTRRAESGNSSPPVWRLARAQQLCYSSSRTRRSLIQAHWSPSTAMASGALWRSLTSGPVLRVSQTLRVIGSTTSHAFLILAIRNYSRETKWISAGVFFCHMRVSESCLRLLAEYLQFLSTCITSAPYEVLYSS